MNKVQLIGRLVNDAKISTVKKQDGTEIKVAKFTLAVGRRGKKDESDFISCVAFDRLGAFLESYGKQGTKFAICGHIQTGKYQNQQGMTVFTTDVIVEEIDFCESKSAEQSAPAQTKQTKTASQDGFLEIPDGLEIDGLPFN